MSTSEQRPHRRVLLTQPTATLAASVTAPASAAVSLEQAGTDIKVTAYLDETDNARLEEVWVKLRTSPARPSKADLIRAAIALALKHPDLLEQEALQQKGLAPAGR